MQDQDTTTTETTVDEKETATIASLFNAVLEKREKARMASLERQLALLAATPEDKPEVVEAQRAADNRNERIISRHQPMDSVYRMYHRTNPLYAGVRTPDLDHWNI
ncbi:MAG TPA: hypothetical protein VFG22_00975, partial [Polyangiales bacterium]|nr:hypothetical protein [Polyangiales bacterium]